jgi:hypothetical protein
MCTREPNWLPSRATTPSRSITSVLSSVGWVMVRPIRLLPVTVAAALVVLVAVAPPASAGEVEPVEQHPAIVIDIYWGDGCPVLSRRHRAPDRLRRRGGRRRGADLRGLVRPRQSGAHGASRRRARSPGRGGAAHRRGNPDLVRVQRCDRPFDRGCGARTARRRPVRRRGAGARRVVLGGDRPSPGRRHGPRGAIRPARHRPHRPGRRVQPLLAVGPHRPVGPRAPHRVPRPGPCHRRHVPRRHHLVYGLFIVGVYSTLGLVSAMDGIRLVVAVFALTFGGSTSRTSCGSSGESR